MTDRPTSAAATLVREARLAEARDLLLARVKAAPADPRARLDLAELLIVLGDYERADNHADVASTLDPAIALPTALTRQLIRAATWRRETFDQRRAPDLVTEPDDATAAAVARLAGVASDVVAGDDALFVVDGRPGAGLRDLDDRTAAVLEVLTSTGNYVWVPYAAIVSLRIAKPERLRDVVWRQAELDVRGGPSGVVYLPAIYHAAAAEQSDEHRLGRATDWIDDGETARGLGLRTFLVGDDALALDEIAELDAA